MMEADLSPDESPYVVMTNNIPKTQDDYSRCTYEPICVSEPVYMELHHKRPCTPVEECTSGKSTLKKKKKKSRKDLPDIMKTSSESSTRIHKNLELASVFLIYLDQLPITLVYPLAPYRII